LENFSRDATFARYAARITHALQRANIVLIFVARTSRATRNNMDWLNIIA
jgi:hypothetical protein